jgi:hypothetical protein
VRLTALAAYEKMIGFEFEDFAGDEFSSYAHRTGGAW